MFNMTICCVFANLFVFLCLCCIILGHKSNMSENMTNENIANGNDKVVDEPEQVVSPDMLYKLSKKIGKDFSISRS